MKFKINNQILRQKLLSVGAAVGRRPSFAVLKYVRMVAGRDGTLRVGATNLSLSIETSVPAEVTEAGSILLPYMLVMQVLERLPADEGGRVSSLESTKDHQVIIQSGTEEMTGTAEVHLAGMNPEEWPADTFAITDEVQEFTLPGDVFRSGIVSVLNFVSDDATRPALQGVKMSIGRGELVLATTDGFRLAEWKLEREELAGIEIDAVLDGTAIAAATNAFRNTETIRVIFNCNMVRFATDRSQATLTLQASKFPSYESIVSEALDYESLLSVERGPLLKAVDLARVIALHGDGASKIVTLTLQDDDSLSVEASVKGIGRNAALCRGVTVQRERPPVLSFNGEYLVEALTACPGERLSLLIRKNIGRALALVAEDPGQGQQWMCIVMPVHPG